MEDLVVVSFSGSLGPWNVQVSLSAATQSRMVSDPFRQDPPLLSYHEHAVGRILRFELL